MTLILTWPKLDLNIPKVNLHTKKNFLGQLGFQMLDRYRQTVTDRQTDTQTNATENITLTHSRAVKTSHFRPHKTTRVFHDRLVGDGCEWQTNGTSVTRTRFNYVLEAWPVRPSVCHSFLCLAASCDIELLLTRSIFCDPASLSSINGIVST